MKIRKMGFLLIIGLIMLISVADGATLYVDNDESGTNIASTINVYPSINDALAVADEGDTIHLYDGIYTETLHITKSLVVEGDSRSGVIIDCAGIDGYGIYVTADNVTLRYFTLNNSTSYGIKPSGVSNVLIEDVTAQNCGRTGIDLNGVTDSTVNNVKITGTFYGNGLSITDSQNIDVRDITTSGNAWGGIAVYTMGNFYPGGTDNVVFTGSMNLGEVNPFYTEVGNSSGGVPYPITDMQYPPKFNYIVKSLTIMPNHEFHQKLMTDVVTFVQLSELPGAAAMEIASGEYHVSEGLSIQTAVDTVSESGVVIVEPGTYEESVTVNKSLKLDAPYGATIKCPTMPENITLAESSKKYELRSGYSEVRTLI